MISLKASASSSASFAKSRLNDVYRRNLVTKLREHALQRAKKVCKQSQTQECAIAWDLVNDYDYTLRRMNQVLEDPMETFCALNPSDLECREYDL